MIAERESRGSQNCGNRGASWREGVLNFPRPVAIKRQLAHTKELVSQIFWRGDDLKCIATRFLEVCDFEREQLCL